MTHHLEELTWTPTNKRGLLSITILQGRQPNDIVICAFFSVFFLSGSKSNIRFLWHYDCVDSSAEAVILIVCWWIYTSGKESSKDKKSWWAQMVVNRGICLLPQLLRRSSWPAYSHTWA